MLRIRSDIEHNTSRSLSSVSIISDMATSILNNFVPPSRKKWVMLQMCYVLDSLAQSPSLVENHNEATISVSCKIIEFILPLSIFA